MLLPGEIGRECIYLYYKTFILNIHAPDCLIFFSLQQLSWQTTPTTGKNQPSALVFMVHICQISLITLSVLSNYLFLYICIEYHMHLCQTVRRGKGESDNQIPMEIFFVFFGFIYKRQTQELDLPLGRTDPGGLLCSGFSPVVLPDAKPSSTTEFSSSFPAVPGCGLQLQSAAVPHGCQLQ